MRMILICSLAMCLVGCSCVAPQLAMTGACGDPKRFDCFGNFAPAPRIASKPAAAKINPPAKPSNLRAASALRALAPAQSQPPRKRSRSRERREQWRLPGPRRGTSNERRLRARPAQNAGATMPKLRRKPPASTAAAAGPPPRPMAPIRRSKPRSQRRCARRRSPQGAPHRGRARIRSRPCSRLARQPNQPRQSRRRSRPTPSWIRRRLRSWREWRTRKRQYSFR